MEKKNGFEEVLVPGGLLQEYVKNITKQYRSDRTEDYSGLLTVVETLEQMAKGCYITEKQRLVQLVAYAMMCYTTSKAWDYDGRKLDEAKEKGRKVKDLPLGRELLDLMGDYGEVPASSHVDATTLEVSYWCVYGKKNSEIIKHTAELARQGCIMVGLMRSLTGKEA